MRALPWAGLLALCLTASTACSSTKNGDGSSPDTGSATDTDRGGPDGGITGDGGSQTDTGGGDGNGDAGNGDTSTGDTGTSTSDRLFPDTAPWNVDVSQAPVDSESADVIAYLDQVGFGLGHIQIDFSMEVLDADASAPFMDFQPTRDWYDVECDDDAVPVPAGGRLEGESGYACTNDGDCHLLVVHHPSQTLYEMWRADIQEDTFRGGCLAVWDLTKDYVPHGRGEQCTSADAAGLPITPLLFDADEVAGGEIDHAIRFILPNDRIRASVYVHPATHSTGATSGPASAPPYGARLRLKSDFDMSKLPNDAARTVARALQKYGMILADAGNVALTARNDTYSTSTWDGLMGSHDLEAIQPSDFEMVDGGVRYAYDGDCVRQ